MSAASPRNHGERLATLETEMDALQTDLGSMKKDMHEINGKMTSLLITAGVSKKFFVVGMTMVGVIWPVVYGIIFLTRQS